MGVTSHVMGVVTVGRQEEFWRVCVGGAGGEREGWVWVSRCLVARLWSLATHSVTTSSPPHLRSYEGVGGLRRGRHDEGE